MFGCEHQESLLYDLNALVDFDCDIARVKQEEQLAETSKQPA
jgi:hypothetical protein